MRAVIAVIAVIAFVLAGCLSDDVVCNGWQNKLHDGQARYNKALWEFQTQCFGRADRDTRKCGAILHEELQARQLVIDMDALGNACESQSSLQQMVNRCPASTIPNSCQ